MGLALILEELQLLGIPAPPSTQRRFLSQHEVLIACPLNPKAPVKEVLSSQGVCVSVCVCAHARACAES